MRPRFTRRHALQTLTSLGALAVSRGASLNTSAGGAMIPVQAGGVPADQDKRWKGSALGNLYPFIREEQQRTRQRLAFLQRRPKDLEAWKAECRKKVFDALVYRPTPCKPDAKILERVDKGDYIRERLTFHTAPNVTVPAYLLIPKRAKLPAPAVVALHDHSGFYYWGKEHIIETENEHPALTAFRQRLYDFRTARMIFHGMRIGLRIRQHQSSGSNDRYAGAAGSNVLHPRLQRGNFFRLFRRQ